MPEDIDAQVPYEGIDRRAPTPTREALAEVMNLLSKATSSAADLSEKVEDLITTRKKMLRMQTATLIGMALMTIDALAMVWVVFEVRENAKANRKNSRFLIECLTPSPPPGRKPLYPEERIHECYEARGTETQKLVQQIVDTNGDGVMNHDELLAKQDEVLRILNQRKP